MIYLPKEDSFLMSDILKKEIPTMLKKNSELKFLEIGSGSGIQLETAFNLGAKKQNIFSVDIDKRSVAHCSSLGFHCIYSDLFANVSGKFDLIVFNPPYLPENSDEPEDSKTATTGGKEGSEIINRFLEQAKNYLASDGKIFLITSSLTEEIRWGNWKRKLLGCEKLFFERLCVWEFTS